MKKKFLKEQYHKITYSIRSSKIDIQKKPELVFQVVLLAKKFLK